MVDSAQRFSSLLQSLHNKTIPTLITAKHRIITIHYRRRNADYEGWKLHIWDSDADITRWNESLTPTGYDHYGIYWEIPIRGNDRTLNYIIHREHEKDPGPDQSLRLFVNKKEVWQVQGQDTHFNSPQEALAALEIILKPAPRPNKNQTLLHYRRINADYDGWNLHVWGDTPDETGWDKPLRPSGQDDYGL